MPSLSRCFLLYALTFTLASGQTDFESALNALEIEVRNDPQSPWQIVSAPRMIGESAVATPFLNEISGASSALRITLQGPGTLEFSCRTASGSSSNPISLEYSGPDGQGRVYVTGEWGRFEAELPPGASEIVLSVNASNQRDRVVIDQLDVGGVVENVVFESFGGNVTVEPGGLEVGDESPLLLTAAPNPGWEFDFWDTGVHAIPFGPKKSDIISILNKGRVYALFKHRFEAFGLEFEGGGVRPWIEENGYLRSGPRGFGYGGLNFASERSWADAEVFGPAIIEIEGSHIHEGRVFRAFVDGRRVEGVKGTNRMRIELGKGQHRIRLMSSLADTSQTLDEFGRHVPFDSLLG